MAGFYTHISVSSVLGVAVGAAGYFHFQYDWGVACLAGGLTAIGGMLPDLDSDSGIPVRELFGVAALFVPMLLIERLRQFSLTPEQFIVILAGSYLLVRYGVSEAFKRLTVHRGMFHSVPAMLIAGLVVFLLHVAPPGSNNNADLQRRLYYGVGVMIGFLSHLVLDEIYAVDLMGGVPKLNQFAGSALKLKSESWTAMLVAYGLLLGLGYLAWVSSGSPAWDQAYQVTISPLRK